MTASHQRTFPRKWRGFFHAHFSYHILILPLFKMCAHMCGDAWGTWEQLCVSSSGKPFTFFIRGSLTSLTFINQARAAGQQSQGSSYLCLHTAKIASSPCQTFLNGFWRHNLVPLFVGQTLYQLSHCPSTVIFLNNTNLAVWLTTPTPS